MQIEKCDLCDAIFESLNGSNTCVECDSILPQQNTSGETPKVRYFAVGFVYGHKRRKHEGRLIFQYTSFPSFAEADKEVEKFLAKDTRNFKNVFSFPCVELSKKDYNGFLEELNYGRNKMVANTQHN